MPHLGRSGDVGFNRHRRDGTAQVWGGHTHGKEVSNVLKQVLDEPEYNCNPDPSSPGRIHGPKKVSELLAPHPKHNSKQYKALQDAKLGPDRPLLWARDSKGKRCTYKTQPFLSGWPAVNAEQAKEACRYYPHQPSIIMKASPQIFDPPTIPRHYLLTAYRLL